MSYNASHRRRWSLRRRKQVTDVNINPPCLSTEFMIRGLDYLPEFEKRRLRFKSCFSSFSGPGSLNFSRVDPRSWSLSYLHFMNDSTRAESSSCNSKAGCSPSSTLWPHTDNVDDDVDARRNPILCVMCDEEATPGDWQTYKHYDFENLVLSGGGSKGYAYLGALKTLDDCGILNNIKRLAGSSAGAICAGLLAVGCTPQEIADVFKYDIKWLFHDQRSPCCSMLPRVFCKYGVHPARRFYEVYGHHLFLKVGNADITFKQVYDQCNRELCIVVTNLSRMCAEYCSFKTCPDLPIRKAVRMSMAFPVVFHAVRCNITGRECLYSDGGLLDQYPIHCFDGPGMHDFNDQDTKELPFNVKTLGLYVVSEKALDYKIWKTLFGTEIPYKPTYLPNTKLARARLKKEMLSRKRQDKLFSKEEFMNDLRTSDADDVEFFDHYEIMDKSHVDISNLGAYFIATIETLLISQRKLRVKATDAIRTIPINCGYVGTNDANIEPGDRAFMINGYECTRRFLRELVTRRTA